MQSYFSGLDLTQVPHGILFDYGLPLLDTRLYHGLSLEPENLITKYDEWKFGYGAMSLGQVNGNTTFPNHIQTFNNLQSHYQQSKRYPLVVILAKYSKIKEDAVANNLIHELNDVLYDVPGRPQSPYESHEVFMASIANMRPLNSNVVPVEFDKNWFFSNVMPFETMYVDFGDGNGKIQVTDGFKYEITYPDTGTYTIEFELQTSEGIRYAHSNLRIARLQPVFDLNIPIDANSLHSGVQTQVQFGCGRKKLMKPLIYVQGFEFTGLEEFSVEDAENKLLRNQMVGDLLNEYDLIFIKFDEAQDDIQRNTEALIEAIHKINALKWQNGSNEPNLVIGESMGGLIARLALRKIEVEQLSNPNVKHDCSRLIVFDSPNLGANVPISAQLIVDEVGSSILGHFISEVRLAYQALHSQAARQMLIYHIDNAARFEKDELLGLLQLHGNPQLCEVIGISNGVDNGVGQGFAPGDPFVDIDYRVTPMAAYNRHPLLGLLVFTLPVRAEFIVKMNSAPNYSTNPFQIFYAEAYVSFNWGWRKNYLIIPTTRIVTRMYPHDSGPGGNYSLEGFEIPTFASNHLINNRFGYIPTPSGLNMAAQMQTPYLAFNGVNVTPTGNGWSTFNQAIREGSTMAGPLTNRMHTTITAENQNGFANAMIDWSNNAPFLPSSWIGSSTFNYGDDLNGNKTRIFHTTNTTIANNGKLCVNCDELVGNSAMTSAQVAAGESFGVAFLRPCNGLGLTTIEVLNGGKFELGKNSNQYSKSHFGTGTHLIIRSGGELVINNRSELSIDQGATITIEAGASIILNGAEAVLEVGGNMVIPANYTFQHLGNGYVRFRTPNIIAGVNAKFSFVGNGASDKIMEVADNASLVFPPNVVEFQLENGLVQLGAASVVDVFTKVILKNAIVTGSPQSLYNRFGINAKAGTVIQNSTFTYGNFGLRLGQLSQAVPLVSNCIFINNNTGIFINTTTVGAQIIGSTFQSNHTAIRGEGLSLPVAIESCNIYNSHIGVNLQGWNLTQFNVKNSFIQASQTGMRVFGGNLNIQETNFQGTGNSSSSVGLLVEGHSVARPRCVNISGFHVGSDIGTDCHLNLASGSTSNFTGNAIGLVVNEASLSVQNAQSSLQNNSLYSIYGVIKPNPEFHKQTLSSSSGDFQFYKWPIYRLKLNSQPYPFVNAQGNFVNTTSPINTFDFTAVNGTIIQVNTNVSLPIFIECNQCNLIFACDAVEVPPYYSEWILDPANGATGRMIYTSYFPGVELLTAIRSALDEITFEPDMPVNDLSAVLKLKQLLSLTYTDITEEEHLALMAAAKFMGLALSNAYAYKQLNAPELQNPEPLSEEEQFLVDLLEAQKQSAEAQLLAELVIAQAQIYRLAGHYETAIDLINSQEASYASHNKQGYWSCLLPLEYDFLMGNLSDGDYLDMSAQCSGLFQMRRKPYPTRLEHNQSISLQNEKHKMEIYPNPGSEGFQLRIPNFNSEQVGQLMILDNLGRKLHSQTYQLGQTIDASSLPAGSYHVSVITSNQKYNALWIKK